MKVRNRTPGRTGSRTCSRRLGRICGRLRSCGGFTLIELVVVMVMVGVLAATVGMKSGWLTSGTNLRMAIDQVAGDLRFIQCRTMAVYSTAPPTTLRSATFPAGGNTYNLGGQEKRLPSGVTINAGLTVTFNSLGEYQAAANTNLVLKSGSLTGGITIYAISGNVEAY
jgi:prepilin-type N-terminal cleavage/methylation domain-containing protein